MLSLNTDMLTTWHLISDTWHLISNTWQLTYCHLIVSLCYHLILIHLTWCCDTWLDTIISDTCITLPDSWLSLLRGIDIIILLLPDILYPWTPVLLNSCALELLIPEPLEQGDSWYYTPVEPRNWLIMDIGLLWIPCGYYHWTISIN